MSREDSKADRIDPTTGVKVTEYDAKESSSDPSNNAWPKRAILLLAAIWGRGKGNRKESLRRLLVSISQSGSDLRRSWKIYQRSLLAMLGLLMVVSVILISVFAHRIAVEHPYRNLQDTEDLWSIDYEPRRAAPFSEECDWHEQKIVTNTRSAIFSEEVLAESNNKVGDDNRYYRDTLLVKKIIKIEDSKGYDLNSSLLYIHPSNSSILVLTPELYNNSTLHLGVWITYEFDNQDMHHSWLPDGYDVCIFGTTDSGQDLFSKVLYGSRVSLKIGFTVALLTVTIGTIVGSVSGYYGGRTDEVIMRICDIFFAVPGLILAMAFVAAMGSVTSLTIPVWLGVILPLLFLATISQSYIASTIFEDNRITDRAMGLLFRYRRWLYGSLGFLFFVGLIPNVPITGSEVSWPSFFGISDSSIWRLYASFAIILLFVFITFADRRFVENSNLDGASERIINSLDWTNPWLFLTLRTIAIFAAIVVLFRFTGTDGSEITLIKDFDRLWKIQAALILTGWPGYARLIRGQVLYVKEMNFVEAARSVGAPAGRIMFRHILPNAWAPLLVAFTLDIGGTILSASGLSFIGLGAKTGTAEWGILVSESRRYFLDYPHLMMYPGLAIAVTVLGFNLLGDGIRDVVDPKNRR
jgi:ABC-type dipeptide/oligopeptide/nickel transport system permease subunit